MTPAGPVSLLLFSDCRVYVFHMKRTTLMIDERQFAELKTLAVAEGRTLSSLTKELLQLGLASAPSRAPAQVEATADLEYGRIQGRCGRWRRSL